MNIAIIPARGGSKRIPRKNIKDFYGKPMISYSIRAAIESNVFDRVIVSTDDKEIARISLEYGAEVPFIRPDDISDDYSTTIDVISHAIDWLEKDGVFIDNVCCIYATAPFIKPTFIAEGLSKLNSEEIDFVFSVGSYSFPIQRAIKIGSEGEVSMFEPENALVRSQDLEDAYHDAGQFYWGTKQAFLERRPIFSCRSRAVLLPRHFVQDIDTLEDWAYAEKLFKISYLDSKC